MVVTDDPQIADRCRSLRNQGRDNSGQWLNHVMLGFNYRLSDVHCAIGLAQLERIEELLQKRERAAHLYDERLRHSPLQLPCATSGCNRSWFVYVVQFQGTQATAKRSEVRELLASRGIASQVYFPAIHRQPYYPQALRRIYGGLQETERAADTCLALPFSSRITEAEINEVCEAVTFAVAPSADAQPVAAISQG